MIEGALFTIGVLTTLGGFGYGLLLAWANEMKPAPDASSGAAPFAIVGLVGIAMVVGACFMKS